MVLGKTVREGKVQQCPRAKSGEMDVVRCSTTCSYHRSRSVRVRPLGEYQKGEGWLAHEEETTHVFCGFTAYLKPKRSGS